MTNTLFANVTYSSILDDIQPVMEFPTWDFTAHKPATPKRRGRRKFFYMDLMGGGALRLDVPDAPYILKVGEKCKFLFSSALGLDQVPKMICSGTIRFLPKEEYVVGTEEGLTTSEFFDDRIGVEIDRDDPILKNRPLPTHTLDGYATSGLGRWISFSQLVVAGHKFQVFDKYSDPDWI